MGRVTTRNEALVEVSLGRPTDAEATAWPGEVVGDKPLIDSEAQARFNTGLEDADATVAETLHGGKFVVSRSADYDTNW